MSTSEAMTYQLMVNGTTYTVDAPYSHSLLRVIRENLGLTGVKEGCDDSECGACMVLLDDLPVNACSYLAAQAAGRAVTTVEGLAPAMTPARLAPHDSGTQQLAPLQQALLEAGGVQCGFCTPGMLISATALLADTPNPTEHQIRVGLGGNLCRCTGYTRIVDAVKQAASQQPATGDENGR